ncbi:MAG: hypothetical protein IT355_18720 [Gemmatimonadaceae bacterium]|nr:hypothetical protein [Gemmatimonadaceae bacterium]
MFHRSLPTALLAVAVLAAQPAAAQSAQRWSIQASGIAVGAFGSAYEGLATGYGGELQARLTPSLWSYGAGIQYSSHGLKTLDGQSIALQGVFFEPRRVFDTGSGKYAPYLSGRIAWLQQSADIDVAFAGGRRTAQAPSLSVAAQTASATGTEITASGFQGNIGGGILTRLSPRVNLDLGVTLGVIRFGDAKLTVNGTDVGTFGGTSGTGQNVVVRAGLAIGLGKGKSAPPAPAPRPAPRPRR